MNITPADASMPCRRVSKAATVFRHWWHIRSEDGMCLTSSIASAACIASILLFAADVATASRQRTPGRENSATSAMETQREAERETLLRYQGR